MSQSADPPSDKLALIMEIQRAFRNVERGNGVTLHETEAIDFYGSDEERRNARAKDTDRNWQEVDDRWIEEFGGVGGLSFLDEEGFRYYLPAYMTYWLRTRKRAELSRIPLRGGHTGISISYFGPNKSKSPPSSLITRV